MGGRLPDDDSEPDPEPASARPLQASGPGGRHLQPLSLDGRGLAALSDRNDQDWYRFDVAEFSQLDLRLESYRLLGPVTVTLQPEDLEARTDEVVSAPLFPPGSGHSRLLDPVAPGGYKVHVRGTTNLYKLTVDLSPVTLLWDQFERNDSFDKATRIRLRDKGALPDAIGALGTPGGVFELNMHDPADIDYFRVAAASTNPLTQPTVRFSRSDAPITIEVYNESRVLVDQLSGQRSGVLRLARNTVSFVVISGAGRITRYRLSIQSEVDQSHLPGPEQEHGVLPMPDPGDPAFGLLDEVTHAYLELDDARRALRRLVLGTVEGRPLRVEVLDEIGAVLMTAESGEAESGGLLELDIGPLKLEGYLLRLSTTPHGGETLHVEVVPSYPG